MTSSKTKIGSKKAKKLSVNKLKKTAWDLFSKIVRLSAADHAGYASCVTCGVVKLWKELQAGHFIPGRHNAILFERRGCHPQCYQCNIPLKSNPRAYDAFMRKKYGEKVIKELEELDKTTKQFTIPELQEMIQSYQSKLKTLE